MPTRSEEFKLTVGKPAWHSLYRTEAWKNYRKHYLENPKYFYCACGCGRLATVVDHIIPHRGDLVLFWDQKNHQPLNRKCHNSKSAKERL